MTGSVYLLTAADVIAVAEEITGNPGVRDVGLIESAVARPGASAFGVDAYPDLWVKSAALMHSIIANHPFVDGNKRTGLVSGIVFLARNGVEVGALDEDAAFDLVIDIAKGVLTEVDEIATAIRAVLGAGGA